MTKIHEYLYMYDSNMLKHEIIEHASKRALLLDLQEASIDLIKLDETQDGRTLYNVIFYSKDS